MRTDCVRGEPAGAPPYAHADARTLSPKPAPQTRSRRQRKLRVDRRLRCPHRPRALPLGVDALLAPHRAVAVRVAVRWGRELVALPVAARGHGRVTREAVAVGAGRLVAIGRRRDRPLGRMEGVERAERPLVWQVLGQQACAAQARRGSMSAFDSNHDGGGLGAPDAVEICTSPAASEAAAAAEL